MCLYSVIPSCVAEVTVERRGAEGLGKKAAIVFNLHPFYGSGYRKSTDAESLTRIRYLVYRTSSLFK